MVVSKFLLLSIFCSDLTTVQSFSSISPSSSLIVTSPVNDESSRLAHTIPSNDVDESSDNLHSQRRSFLANIASATLAITASTFIINPPSAYARAAFENGPLVYGEDSLMSTKSHGTTEEGVQPNLRYGVSNKLADKICSYNRMFAEMGGYFEGVPFEEQVRKLVADSGGQPVTFYDSVSGKPLFKAPVGRSVDAFISESKVHGWPSFRDEEVVWDNVRVLRSSGETVSVGGTHLGELDLLLVGLSLLHFDILTVVLYRPQSS
jgi:hypothetical protein